MLEKGATENIRFPYERVIAKAQHSMKLSSNLIYGCTLSSFMLTHTHVYMCFIV